MEGGTAGAARDVREFRQRRWVLTHRRDELLRAALEERSGTADRDGADGLPVLCRPGWIPAVPRHLDRTEVRWDETDPSSVVRSCRPHSAHLLPDGPDGAPLPSYSGAIAALDTAPGTAFFDGPSFRLLDLIPPDGPDDPFRFRFGRCGYFDAVDTTDVLGLEAAARLLDGPATVATYREWLGDPFDLGLRCGVPGISTLTVCTSPAGPTFFMHRRSPSAVASSAGALHVVPAGEFQPVGRDPALAPAQCDLWSNVRREFAEELLGVAEDPGATWGDDGPPRAPDDPLEQLRASGEATPWILGCALDPVTWKPEVLTALVLTGRAADQLFRTVPGRNEEGTVLAGDGGRGMVLDEAVVRAVVDDPATVAVARACLTLAWRHRHHLGLA